MSTGELSQQEIDALLNRAAERAKKASEARRGGPASPSQAAAPAARAASMPSAQGGALEELFDVPLSIKIRLGEAEMTIEEVIALRDGSVVALDRAPGDAVDILVNDRVVARGEVVVLEDRYSVRVTEVVEKP